MPFYMYKANYTREAMEAMMAKPQDREAAVREFIEASGGKLLNLFFTLGESDVMVITEHPDDSSAAAMALAVASSGSVCNGSTTKLMTSKEFLASMKKAKKAGKSYQPPQG
jgi:uncharacterized protein with GYD domain